MAAARIVWDEMAPAVAPIFSGLIAADHEMLDPRLRNDDGGGQDALFDTAMALDPEGQPLDLRETERLSLVRYLHGLGVK